MINSLFLTKKEYKLQFDLVRHQNRDVWIMTIVILSVCLFIISNIVTIRNTLATTLVICRANSLPASISISVLVFFFLSLFFHFFYLLRPIYILKHLLVLVFWNKSPSTPLLTHSEMYKMSCFSLSWCQALLTSITLVMVPKISHYRHSTFI